MEKFVKPGRTNCKTKVIDLFIQKCFDQPYKLFSKRMISYNFKIGFIVYEVFNLISLHCKKRYNL